MATLATAFSPDFAFFALCRFVTGLGIGGMLASINAMVAEYSNDTRRDFCVSLMTIGYPLGGVLGGMAAAYQRSVAKSLGVPHERARSVRMARSTSSPTRTTESCGAFDRVRERTVRRQVNSRGQGVRTLAAIRTTCQYSAHESRRRARDRRPPRSLRRSPSRGGRTPVTYPASHPVEIAPGTPFSVWGHNIFL